MKFHKLNQPCNAEWVIQGSVLILSLEVASKIHKLSTWIFPELINFQYSLQPIDGEIKMILFSI